MRCKKFGVIVCVLVMMLLVPSSSVFAAVKQDGSNQIPKAVIKSIVGDNEKNEHQRLYSFDFVGRDSDGYITRMIWYLDGEMQDEKWCDSSYVTWDVSVYVDGSSDGLDHVVKLVVVDDEDAKGFCVKSFTVTVFDDVESGVPGSEQGEKEGNNDDNEDDSSTNDDGGYGSVDLMLLEPLDGVVFVGDSVKVRAVIDEESNGDGVGAASSDDDGDVGGYDFKFVFSWGDGSSSGVVFSDESFCVASHVYHVAGVYTVVVDGYYEDVYVGSDSVTVVVSDRGESPLSNGDGVKIYGDHMFAQSFTPWFENLTYVNLSVGCVTTNNAGVSSSSSDNDGGVGLFSRLKAKSGFSGFIDLVWRIISRFFGRNNGNNGGSQNSNSDGGSAADGRGSNPFDSRLGDLVVSIRSDLYGSDLVSKSFTPKEVKNCGGKLVWKLEKEYTLVRGADDPYWEENGLEPKNEDYNDYTYYIVVRTDGGDEYNNYYTWMYGDSYDKGMAWEWVGDYDKWRYDTYNVWGKDFGFELGGCLAWEKEGGDGVVHQYNIVDLWDHNAEKVAPFLRGTSYTSPKDFAYNSRLLDYIDKIDKECDGDDAIVLWIDGDGSPYKPAINGLSAYSIERHFERIPQIKGGICMIFDCCYAGQFADPSKSPVCKPGRVIMASCADWETDIVSIIDGDLWHPFSYYLYEGLQKGYKTAEDLFDYASPKHSREEQIYDTYPGKLQIAE